MEGIKSNSVPEEKKSNIHAACCVDWKVEELLFIETFFERGAINGSR
jgi:hypothetical protein